MSDDHIAKLRSELLRAGAETAPAGGTPGGPPAARAPSRSPPPSRFSRSPSASP